MLQLDTKIQKMFSKLWLHKDNKQHHCGYLYYQLKTRVKVDSNKFLLHIINDYNYKGACEQTHVVKQ